MFVFLEGSIPSHLIILRDTKYCTAMTNNNSKLIKLRRIGAPIRRSLMSFELLFVIAVQYFVSRKIIKCEGIEPSRKTNIRSLLVFGFR